MSACDLVLELLKLLVAKQQDLAKQRYEKDEEAGRLWKAIECAAERLPRLVKTKTGKIRHVLTFQQLCRKLAKVPLPDGSDDAKKAVRIRIQRLESAPGGARVAQYMAALDQEAERLDEELGTAKRLVEDAVMWLAEKVGEPPINVLYAAERHGTRYGLCKRKARTVPAGFWENGTQMVPCAPEVKVYARKDLHHVLPKLRQVPCEKFVGKLRELHYAAAVVEESLAKMQEKFPDEPVVLGLQSVNRNANRRTPAPLGTQPVHLPVLTRLDVEILRTLAKRPCVVITQYDLRNVGDRKTVGSRLRHLRSVGYVKFPEGRKRGNLITDAGTTRLKSLAEAD